MSGASRFFDELLRQYRGNERPMPMLTWMDMEDVMGVDKLGSGLRYLGCTAWNLDLCTC